MKNNIIQDILPSSGSKIPNIEKPKLVEPELVNVKITGTDYIEESFHDHTRASESVISTPVKDTKPVIKINRVNKSVNIKFILIFITAILFVLGLIFIINKYFSYVHIEITPKTEAYTLTKENFSASKENNAPLHFEIMIVDGEDKQDAVFTESKEASVKAHGEVYLYNEFSTKPQKLLINTKIIDDDKRIYLTDKEVTIPGHKTTSGKIVPGSIPVSITASLPGSAYNGEPRDFSIVGFKGTTKATKIYARSNGEISGGSLGLYYTLSPEDKGKVIVDSGTALYNKLVKKLLAQVPPGYIVYKGSMQFTKKLSDEVFQSKTPDGSITISGTLSAPIFKINEFSESVIRSVYPDVKNDEIIEISSPKINDLVFAYTDSNTVINKSTSSFKFNLSGEDTLLWSPNTEALKNKIVGTSKDSLDSFYLTDPGIAKARAKFTPPWQSKLPTDLNHIKISVK